MRIISLSFPVLIATFVMAAIGRCETASVNFVFPVPSPSSVTISAGDSIRFTGASSVHPLQQVTSATSDTPVSGGFSSTSSSFTVMFDTPGTYFYRCTNHGVAALGGTMRGTIIVEAVSENPTPVPTAETDDDCTSKPAATILSSPSKGESSLKSRVSLDWEDTACATKYIVVVHQGKKMGAIVDKKTVNKSNYKTKTLTKKGTYFWSVKACNTIGCTNSAASSFLIQ